MLDESIWRLQLSSGGVLITEDRGPFEISLSKGTDFDWILAFRWLFTSSLSLCNSARWSNSQWSNFGGGSSFFLRFFLKNSKVTSEVRPVRDTFGCLKNPCVIKIEHLSVTWISFWWLAWGSLEEAKLSVPPRRRKSGWAPPLAELWLRGTLRSSSTRPWGYARPEKFVYVIRGEHLSRFKPNYHIRV